MRTLIKAIIILFISALIFVSCRGPGIKPLEREELFSLPLGTMEGQLDFFLQEGRYYPYQCNIATKDGLFYLSSSLSGRVQKFNSYGDLLSMIYHPGLNPDPVTLLNQDKNTSGSNLHAVPWNFISIGKVAVSEDTLFIEDLLAENQHIQDQETGLLLNRVILMFDSKGKYTGYLGRDGLSGTPFPYIDSIRTNLSKNIIVSCKTMTSELIYWFSPEGALMYQIELDYHNLPILETNSDAEIFLDFILPASNSDSLFLKVNYFSNLIENENKKEDQPEQQISQIYRLDLTDQQYHLITTLPEHKVDIDGTEIDRPYEFLGAVRNDNLFFLSQIKTGSYQLMILDRNGKTRQKRELTVEDESLLFRTFYLTPDGLLTALLVSSMDAKVVWWRTDTILPVSSDHDSENP